MHIRLQRDKDQVYKVEQRLVSARERSIRSRTRKTGAKLCMQAMHVIAKQLEGMTLKFMRHQNTGEQMQDVQGCYYLLQPHQR